VTGRHILAFVGNRETFSTNDIKSVSFNGSLFTQIANSGAAGTTTNFLRLSVWRLDDPGGATGNIVATFSTTSYGVTIAAMDVDGAKSGASFVENSSSKIVDSGSSISTTITTSAPDSLLVAVAARNTGAAIVSLTCSAPLVEFADITDSLAGGTAVAFSAGSYQTSVSGVSNLKFQATPATATKLAIMAVAIAARNESTVVATGPTFSANFGGTPFLCPAGFAPPIFAPVGV
jgi:hypothetical protein